MSASAQCLDREDPLSLIPMSYADRPDELCSMHILGQLGIKITSAITASVERDAREQLQRQKQRSGSQSVPAEHKLHLLPPAWTSACETNREHRSSEVTIHVVSKSNNNVFEVRDSADCWIRITLAIGDAIRIPGGVYRRYSPEKNTSYSVDPINNNLQSPLQPRFPNSSDSVQVVKYHTYRELVCELCRQFFDAGWVTGTGGSISIRHGNRIYMTPSGVQKERILPDELFVLDTAGSILSTPVQKPGCRAPKLSDCSPLFLHAFVQRNAGAVLHSHAYCCNIITCLFEGKSEVRISHQEMIKGIQGHGYYDELVIPIIENTAHEHELADALGATIAKYPKSYAVLVRRHGMYVWGDSWEQAKRHGECYHYLFDIVIQMKQLGLDFTKEAVRAVPEPGSKIPVPLAAYIDGNNGKSGSGSDGDISSRKRSRADMDRLKYKHFVFDIEGTTTPITFVKDVLFKYAGENVEAYLNTDPQAAQDVDALYEQLKTEAKSDKNVKLPPQMSVSDKNWPATRNKFLANYTKYCIELDKKDPVLKGMQGRIWKKGYESGELKSVVFDDVSEAFKQIVESGSKIHIYSSGSREAQVLLFKHTATAGDLRSNISCYFDTKVGHKREANSYNEIALHLGVDSHQEILFVTDIWEEAVAAREAGLDVAISIRPGNAPIDAEKLKKFKTVTSFSQLL